MAVNLLRHEVSDLCIGKPPLRTLSVSSTVAEALAALRKFGEGYLSVWSCCDNAKAEEEDCGCRCVGKVCIGDVVCFLAKEENLKNPGVALQAQLSVLVPKIPGLVRHLEPSASLWEAMDLIVEGAQNLVIPLRTPTTSSREKLLSKSSMSGTIHNNSQYCWLTQEDVIRYLLNSISAFFPIPGQPINSLNIIDSDNVLSVHYDDPASVALPTIAQSILRQTSVAILDNDSKLVGEISPFILNSCDESVAAAIAMLSAGDLMVYVDCGGPPEDLIRLVKERLEERGFGAALELMDEELGILDSSSSSSSTSSSSDEEFGMGKSGRFGGYSARMVRRSEGIVCYPWSSLVAVMIQALAHRVCYIWVVEEDGSLAGIVTFAGMIKVFIERLRIQIEI